MKQWFMLFDLSIAPAPRADPDRPKRLRSTGSWEEVVINDKFVVFFTKYMGHDPTRVMAWFIQYP